VPVLSVAALTFRPLPREALAAVDGPAAALYEVRWAPVTAATAQAHAAPEVMVLPAPAGEPVVDRTRLLTEAVLARLRDTTGALLVVTRGAVSVAGEPVTDPAAAAVWGMVRSARVESPDRFALLDVEEAADPAALTAVLASGEPEVALRAGRLFAPRLRAVPGAEEQPLALDPAGTVLVTGGTGGVGVEIVRHLLDRGVSHLTLLSRQPPSESAELRVITCDVADRDQLTAAIAGLDRPVTGVVHAAGVTDDGVVGSLTQDRLRTVVGPKADAAWWLHELTLAARPAFFVLFSSAAATFGAPGQANYAAANAFLDALAEHRTALGLPAQSLAWGMWERRTAITATMTDRDVARLARSGMLTLSTEDALRLFDVALATRTPRLVPLRLDVTVAARAATVPPLLRDLAPKVRRPDPPDLRALLATTPEPARRTTLIDQISRHVAVVLGHPEPDAVHGAMDLRDLGVDSLAALELRNRLTAVTGLRLPASLAFDHPSIPRLADFLLRRLAPPRADGTGAALAGIARLSAALSDIDTADTVGAATRDRITVLLSALLAQWQDQVGIPELDEVRRAIEAADERELFALIDAELGDA
jgi:acyl carrier protein